MGTFIWWFVREAEGQFSPLSQKKLNDFYDGQFRLKASDGFVRVVLVAGETEARGALSVRTSPRGVHRARAAAGHIASLQRGDRTIELTHVAVRADGSGMRSPRAYALLAAALAAGSGCSFIAVRRPPPPPVPPDASLECTQSRVSPALDTAGAIGTPILGIAMWGLCTFTSAMQSWSSDPTHLECGPVLWGTILSTAVYTGSALYGYHATADCRRLAEQRRATPPGSGTRGAERVRFETLGRSE